MNVIEHIQNEQHGTKRPFLAVCYKDESFAMQKRFATHHLAWAYGENWKMLNTAYSYEIKEVKNNV